MSVNSYFGFPVSSAPVTCAIPSQAPEWSQGHLLSAQFTIQGPKESPVSRTLWELGRHFWNQCRPKFSNWVSLEAAFFPECFSVWILLVVVGVARLTQVPPVALELLASFQQFNVRPPAMVLCLVTNSNAVLVQGLLVNLNPCCQKKQASRCHRGHLASLPWNAAACQPLLHSKTFGLSERLGSQSFSLYRGVLEHLSSPQLPTESCSS